ncbi:MAG: carboxymuconolactone decarboxylase family protein [Burkholderiaceae bacterium]|nr:carboxymuconolactone decarboxylase family protein [Burkholderiaceae bacterium]
MPRIPYVPEDIQEPADVVSAVRARRGGKLISLDRMLLHSPPLAAGWNTFLGAVRTGLLVDPKLRELAMCVVAVLNGAEYEFTQHAPLYLKAGGSEAQMQALRDPQAACADSALFDALQRATMALTIEMTRSVHVSDATFANVRAHLSERETVELVGVIAAYNMVSRFLVATGIEPD